MDKITYGEIEIIKPYKYVQSVMFDGLVVGWIYFDDYRQTEVFWSIYLTKEQADSISASNDEAEDKGFYQVNFCFFHGERNLRLHAVCEKIRNIRYGKDGLINLQG